MSKKPIVLWASAHALSAEQRTELEGQYFKVLTLEEIRLDLFGKLTKLTTTSAYFVLATTLANIASDQGYDVAQPAGNGLFHTILGVVWTKRDVQQDILFASSERCSEDIAQPDGSVKKVSVFKHLGFNSLIREQKAFCPPRAEYVCDNCGCRERTTCGAECGCGGTFSL